ncbi:xanthine and co dehydrogenases maturation family [Lasius niger]|uniref:Xanthine and co dehydrogenases maturation family n=1 Tax=Lasius niger TaxID=67767 RepID=A0A0J7KQV8_LASNI|nr:xanthine and co dehydrogenases maturation family [Lasius niger]
MRFFLGNLGGTIDAKRLSTIEKPILNRWLAWEMNQTFAKNPQHSKEGVKRSQARRLSSLRSFFRWLEHEKGLENTAIFRLRGPRLSKNLPRPLNVKDALGAPTEIASAQKKPELVLRDIALFSLLYGAGLRIGEALKINIGQIRGLKGTSLRVIGKGNKERLVPLIPEVLKPLQKYLEPAGDVEKMPPESLKIPTPKAALLTDRPKEIFAFILKAFEEKQKCTLVTLVEIIQGSSRALGVHMAVREDGLYCGFVSGGCVEGAVAQEALAALSENKDRFCHFGKGSPHFDIVLPCGGGIKLAIHLLKNAEPIKEILSFLGKRENCFLEYHAEKEKLLAHSGVKETGWTGKDFYSAYRPATRLFLSGGAYEAGILAEIAESAGLEIICPNSNNQNEILQNLEDWSDENTAIALLHHDPERAGYGTRFSAEADKLGALLDNKPVAHHLLDSVKGFAWAQKILVCRKTSLWATSYQAAGFELIFNEKAQDGMSSSLKKAVLSAHPEITHLFICLADMPFISQNHLKKMLEALEAGKAIASQSENYKGPPAIFALKDLQKLPETGKRGARSLLQEALFISCPPQEIKDIDRKEDLKR